MTAKHDWFWFELITDDPKAAAAFYSSVVGWEISSFPAPEGAPEYLVGNVAGRGVVGFMGKPPAMPASAPSFWSGYVYAPNVDALASDVEQAGGKVVRAPFDVPGVGRIAVLSDPEGGMFNAMKPAMEGVEGPPPFGRNEPGHVSWGELHSDDPEENFAWYEKLFGWRRVDVFDMGPNGKYQIFTTSDTPATSGSCGKMGGDMPTGWLFYFHVDGIDAGVERVHAAGGKIFMGPHEVPGGSWIAMGNDPQGAVFALHAVKR